MTRKLLSVASATALLVACQAVAPLPDAATDSANAIQPESWPLRAPVVARNPEHEQQIDALLARMTLEEKVGQIVQADIGSVTPQQVREYHLGSVLNGGSSAPGGDNRAAPQAWLALADEFWVASTDTSDGGVGIPVMWGTDAVHGHSNIMGATIFPHNIGLGMARDPELLYRIGKATALEMLATGMDWTFAPTIAVARNDRWGRTYESYSEDPQLVAAYAPKIIEGLQGRLGSDEFLGPDRMIATAKHFVGDGGTTDGIDQGDTAITQAELRDIHAAGYPAAIEAGVQSVMASFNSFHGEKMHGYKMMLDDVLVDRLGFDGFVVGDWNGHGQVAGCTNTDCAQSFNAGLDMFMAPDSWQQLYANLLKRVKSGDVSGERLDEAVARVLRVKLRAGLMSAGKPSTRPNAGRFELLSSSEHRAIAREAVRKSLVLLKNNTGVLPLQPGARVLVTGDGAHDIGKQSGGWTLSWQGTGNGNAHFPHGVSVFSGLQKALVGIGGEATLSEDGAFDQRPDVAVVVFGEDPYAEFQGDREHVEFVSDAGLILLEQFAAEGIPTVSVFLSGRPMWVNPELNASDAFVAAWLPGTAGGDGIADVLVADAAGNARHDFTGRLSFSWPKLATDVSLNWGDADYDPLFAYGFGLSYADDSSLPMLSTHSGLSGAAKTNPAQLVAFGDPLGQWSLYVNDGSGDTRVGDSRARSADGGMLVSPVDVDAQEDAIRVDWHQPGTLFVEGPAQNFAREFTADLVLQLHYRVVAAPTSAVHVGVGESAVVDVTTTLQAQAHDGWQTGELRLACFAADPDAMTQIERPIQVISEGALGVEFKRAGFVPNPGDADCTL